MLLLTYERVKLGCVHIQLQASLLLTRPGQTLTVVHPADTADHTSPMKAWHLDRPTLLAPNATPCWRATLSCHSWLCRHEGVHTSGYIAEDTWPFTGQCMAAAVAVDSRQGSQRSGATDEC